MACKDIKMPCTPCARGSKVVTKRKRDTPRQNVEPRRSQRIAERLGGPTPKKHDPRRSTEAGWNRLFSKYSPTTEVQTSPIKATQGNLKTVQSDLKDKYVYLYTWAINMSEQYIYDNTFILLSFNRNDEERMKLALRRDYAGVDMNFFKNLENLVLLGAGAFGSVYSCQDPATQKIYAVKMLSMDFKIYTDHAENLLDYMEERNSIIRAMDNPFVVKFYYSLQVQLIGTLFLFFEFCIGDLMSFIESTAMKNPQEISRKLYNNDLEIIQTLFKDEKELFEASLIYIFETFCGLDFLVQSNIIHQDIKPENIMISSNLHLKIGDFGLAYRTRLIQRDTNKMLMKVSEIDKIESTNYIIETPGTPYYQDLELQLLVLRENANNDFLYVTNSEQMFDAPGLSVEEDVLQPTFLVDTWAAGVCAVMLLLKGFGILDPEHIHDNILTDLPRKNRPLFVTHLVARKSIYMNYIHEGLIKAGGQDHEELMTFLASIFRPRPLRCSSYTKEKQVYHFKRLHSMKYVDMDKVERISTFAVRNFTRSRIHLVDVPPKVGTYFHVKEDVKFEKFQYLLKYLEDKKKRTRKRGVVLELNPGVNINFFT